MKQLSMLFALLGLLVLGSCAKEKVKPTNDSNTVNIVDWVTGTNVGTLTENVAEDRSGTTFINNSWGGTTKYSEQADLYQGGVLIASTPVYWLNAGGSYSVVISGNCGELETTMVAHFGRKLPSVACSVSINWAMGAGSGVGTETFTIAAGGTTKTHVFPPCE